MNILKLLTVFINDEDILVDNNTEIAILIVFLTFFLVGILFLIVFVTIPKQARKKELKKIEMFKNERIYIINYKESSPTVDYFDFNNLRQITTISFADFLNFFPDSDQNDVKTFISALLNLEFNPLSKDAILITNVIVTINKKKLPYRAILKCNCVDKEKNCLYLSSSRLIHTPVDHRVAKRNSRNDVYEVSEIKKMYDEGRFSKGIMTIVRLFVKPNNISYYNEYLIKRNVIDALYSKTTNNVSFFYSGSDPLEFAILDLRTFNDYQLSRHSYDICNVIQKYMNIRGYSEIYDFKVCSSQVADLPMNYDSAYLLLADLFKATGEINRQVSIYSKGKNEISILESAYKAELKKIIKEKDFTVSYAPIVHITNSRASVFAYTSNVDFNSTILTNNEEIFNCAKAFNLSEQLLSIVLRNIVPTFLSQSPSPNFKLVIDLSYKYISEAIDVIKNIQDGDKANIIFCLPSIDLIDEEENNALQIKLSEIKRNGFDLAVFTKTGDYVLKGKTYSMFDYCFIDPLLDANVKQDSRSFIKFKELYDKIYKTGVPIVAVNAKSFQSMELLSKTGVKDFTNDSISKKDLMILPLNPKIQKKLVTMVK
jgi:EAL domain-containing protein (putative c-di-GMP-specific phosphodiesterase class I)